MKTQPADARGPDGPAGRSWLLPTGLVLLALGVRGLYLWQTASSPTFDAPVIDAARYDALGRHLAAGGALDAAFFWQPSFYPLWLGLLYALFGPSLLLAKGVGVGLAGITCLLAYRLGLRVGGRAVAAGAAGIHALYGPAVFFETELGSAGFATLLTVALPLAALRAEERRDAPSFALAGLLGGLALWCRPELGLAVAGVGLWLLWRILGRPSARPHAQLTRGRGALLAATFVAGLLAVAAPVGWLSSRHGGNPSGLPLSGGLNLWLGNAPDLCQTLTLRPGEKWQQLVDEPARALGERSPRGQERYFLGKTADAARQDPAALLGNLGRKALRLLASREVPRNLDLYQAREYSSLQRALVWRLGPFGFPFGLLLPLGALGLLAAWRRVPAPLWLVPMGLALALVLVFPSARHRLPLVPLLAVLAALGALALGHAVRARRLRPLWPGGAVALALLGLGTLPGRFCEEKGPFAGELHLGVGAYHEKHGRPEAARRHYEAALGRAPTLHEAKVNLGALLHRQGDREGALARYDAALAQAPGSAQARLGRALVLLDLDRLPATLADLRALVRVEPWVPGHWFLLGQVSARARLFREAQAAFQASLRRAPDDPQSLNALAWLATGRDDPALRRPTEAIRLAKRACALTRHQDPSLLDTLAAAHEAAGQRKEARALYIRAIELARSQGKTALAQEIETRLRAAGPGASGGSLPAPARLP